MQFILCPQFLHVFSINLSVILNKIFFRKQDKSLLEVFCIMYAGWFFFNYGLSIRPASCIIVASDLLRALLYHA